MENTEMTPAAPAASSGASPEARPPREQREPREQRDSHGGPRGGKRGGRFGPRPPRVCPFCAQKIHYIDFKQVDLLRRFVSDRGKIKARRKAGTCAKHQRRLAVAIKRARHVALLPYVAEAVRGE
jgi:small subunit ribosomal protein S18